MQLPRFLSTGQPDRRVDRWWTWLICAVVMASAAMIGLRSQSLLSSSVFSLLLMGTLGVVFFLVVLVRPMLGLLALPLLANTVRFEIATGTQTRINIAFLLALVLVGAWLLRMLMGRGIRIESSYVNAPALLLMGAFAFSLLAGRIAWDDAMVLQFSSAPVQVTQVLIVCLSVGVMLMVGNTFLEQHIERFVAVFLVLCTLVIINALLSAGGLRYLFIMTVGMLPSLAVAFSTSLAVCVKSLPRWQRVGLLLVTCAWFYWALSGFAGLASAWIPPLVGLVVILAVNHRRALLVLLAAAAILALLRPDVVIGPITQASGGGAELRLGLFSSTLQLAAKSLMFGLGPGNYRPYTLVYSAYAPDTFGQLPDFLYTAPSHNQYLDILAQAGVFALVAYLWLLIVLALIAWRLFRQGRSEFSRAYGLASLGAIAATAVIGMIGDWVVPYVYNIGVHGFRQSVFIWVLFGGLLALSAHSLQSDLSSRGVKTN